MKIHTLDDIVLYKFDTSWYKTTIVAEATNTNKNKQADQATKRKKKKTLKMSTGKLWLVLLVVGLVAVSVTQVDART